MSDILDALTHLNQSLDGLEEAASDYQNHVALQSQQDLFASQKNVSETMSPIEPSLLAQKLDVTIERMEQMLREG
jgi:hypothetical protein